VSSSCVIQEYLSVGAVLLCPCTEGWTKRKDV